VPAHEHHRGPRVLIFAILSLFIPLGPLVAWPYVTRAANHDLRLIERGEIDPAGYHWYTASKLIVSLAAALVLAGLAWLGIAFAAQAAAG